MTVLSVDSAQVPFLLRVLFPDPHLGPLGVDQLNRICEYLRSETEKSGNSYHSESIFCTEPLISGVFGLTPLNVDFNTARLTHASATLLSAYGSITKHVIGEFLGHYL